MSTSRFRELAKAIAAPLGLARRSPAAIARIRELRTTLATPARAARDLWIPADARRRFGEAHAALESEAPLEPTLDRVARRLEPVLDGAYPRRALAQPPRVITGVGPRTETLLAHRGIETVEDLLWFLPRSYEDRRELLPVEALRVGHPACFEGTVTRAGLVPLRGGRSFFEAVVTDGTAAVGLKWFRGFGFLRERLRPGARVLVAGDVRRWRFAKELHHPEVEVLDPDTRVESLPRIVPVYAGVEGIAPRTLRGIVARAVRAAADLVDPFVPAEIAERLGLPPVFDAIRQVHLPGPDLDPDELRRRWTPHHLRLAAEELFLLQIALALRRADLARRPAKPLDPDHPLVRRSRASLPFELTGDQLRAWEEIAADLSRPHPMNRLLVGDVGTGKTVLALLAAVGAHAAGARAALLAPTEILAEQHQRVLHALGAPIGLRVALLTASVPAAERRRLERAVALGEIPLVVGTHALLSERLRIPDLRLVVIDEQQRFGVVQRELFRGKGESPHVLVMTATPIPRTLALTLFGELDHSVLVERPPGRAPVETSVVPPSSWERVVADIKRTVLADGQVYVVYPLVEESEKQDLLDATRGYEELRRALPEVRVGLLHGRLDAAARVRSMAAFASGEVRILVATTVVEVGVDVPAATLLVVRHAERFGLAQLHQLRGRVGRGERPGRAILVAEATTEEASRRLAALEGSASGFDIAEEDLRIRGPGEWLGTRQAGRLPELRLADLVRHGDLVPPLRDAALRLVGRDARLRHHPVLRDAVERRWGRRVELGGVA